MFLSYMGFPDIPSLNSRHSELTPRYLRAALQWDGQEASDGGLNNDFAMPLRVTFLGGYRLQKDV